MTDIHPHWKATDNSKEPNAEIPVEEAAVTKAAPAQGAKVSRLPAAIVGMALVVAIVYFFAQGLFTLRGQLLDEVSVHITSELADPYSVTLEQGQTIAWFNERPLPQIMMSDTFCSPEGECLTTEPLFQGDTVRYTIPFTIAPGTYTYTSETATEDVLGEIVVLEGVIDVFEDIQEEVPATEPDFPTEEEITTEELMDLLEKEAAPEIPEDITLDDIIEELAERRTGEPEPEPEPAAPPPEPEPEKSPVEILKPQEAPDALDFEVAIPKADTPRAPKRPMAEIPRNPYTVGANITGPAGDLHASAPPPWLPMDQGPPLQQVRTQRPPAQPSTGAGAWFALFLSISAMYLVGRRYVRRVVC